MKVFAISDLHLSVNNPKPMDIFGPVWENYLDKIFQSWKENVSDEDIVLLAGDFSWAMNLENTRADFDLIASLPGKKILIRGNHDYWWKSISTLRAFLPQNFFALQNDALKIDNVIFCGTRSWQIPDYSEPVSPENDKIYKRELIRLEMSLQAAKKLQTAEERIVCMLHYPPLPPKKQESEVTALIEKYGAQFVVFGHLHGYRYLPLQFEKNEIKYFLTSCDLVDNKLVYIGEF